MHDCPDCGERCHCHGEETTTEWDLKEVWACTHDCDTYLDPWEPIETEDE